MENYEEISCIGEGSFGRALLCRDRRSGEEVVIKQVDMSQQSEVLQEAALRESNLLSELHHPNIIKFYDSFMDGDNLCTVMEYASNGDLASKIRKIKEQGIHFSEFIVLNWFSQMCLALQYIHTRHILHRDIKSQNIFLDADQNIKLGDFGTAKCLEETGEFAETVVGSPFYLSPEICQGVPYNSKTDIWSLGCVLYEMCTLEPAFSGDCIGGIVMKIIREEQPPIPGEYSTDLSNLVDAMLQKAPGRRPTITQILSLSFMKPFLPISMVSTVVIHKMTIDKIREKRPKSILGMPKKEKKEKKEVKQQDIGLCLMVKPLGKDDQPMQPQNQQQKPVLHVRKPTVPPKLKKQQQQRKQRQDKGEIDLGTIKNCLQPRKIEKKKQSAENSSESCEEQEYDELAACTEFETPPIPPQRTRAVKMEEIEQMRNHLENILGCDVLLEAYNAIKEGKSSQTILNIIGERNKNASVLIQRLILLEEGI